MRYGLDGASDLLYVFIRLLVLVYVLFLPGKKGGWWVGGWGKDEVSTEQAVDESVWGEGRGVSTQISNEWTKSFNG